ncbi:hypothetical protein CMI37_01390 [Candidatus Pacearchaeota archaeon]|nr:hypothetical protein [Candidatus Pacearchaeota archaeon]|tara:strand:- start:93 stop:806 length:714 start_codon:yes stop_codon:yes gene_type:complete
MANLGLGLGVSGGAPIGVEGLTYNEYSLLFDGLSDYVQCGSPVETQHVSLSAWVKPTQIGDYVGVCGCAQGTGVNGYRLGISTTGKIDALIGHGSGYEITLGDTSIVVDTWNHIAMTAGDNFIRVYLNGAEDNATPTARTITTTFNNDFIIGAWSDLGSKYEGYIDEISLWNTSLSAGDIADIYNLGVPTDLSGTTDVAFKGYWTFNDGTTANDTSGEGNHGTITGATHQTDIPPQS